MDINSRIKIVDRLVWIADKLLPQEIVSSGQDYLRGYLLLLLLSINIIICLITLPLYIWVVGADHPTVHLAIALDLFCFTGYLSAAYILIRLKRFALAAHITFGVLLAVNLFATQMTGGFVESPVPQLTLFTPIFAFVLFGMRQGSLWLGITCLLCLASYILSRHDMMAFQLIPDIEARQSLEVIFFFCLILMGTTALVFYERMYQNLQNKLREERDSYVYQAGHDMLTGLPNRFQFFDFFEKAIAAARRHKRTMALCYIDLDGFKPVNDQYGHHVGDVILEAVAQRLNEIIRAQDMVARFGGDEFTLLIPDVRGRESVQVIAERVVEKLSQTIDVEGVSHRVTASVGVAFYPDNAETVDELCQKADFALYEAKEQNNICCFYTESAKALQESSD